MREMLEDPLANKGTAFTDAERSRLGLRGLLPSAVETLDQQVARSYRAYQEQPTDIARHINLRALQDTNETLFYRLVSEHVAEMLPIVYTPTVGLACQRFSEIYRRPRGLFISYPDRDRIGEMLRNRPRPEVDVIVVTDGAAHPRPGRPGRRRHGHPDRQAVAVHRAAAASHPAATLPIVLDVGTDNEDRLDDPRYLGWRHAGWTAPTTTISSTGSSRRCAAEAAQRAAAVGGLRHPARPARSWSATATGCCTFNDDIQGTAAVRARRAGRSGPGQRVAAARPARGHARRGLGRHRRVRADRPAMVADGLTEAEARARIFVVDVDGLLTAGRADLSPAQRRLAQPRGRGGRSWPGQQARLRRRDGRRAGPPR